MTLKWIIIIFCIIASALSLFTLAYVIVEYVVSSNKKDPEPKVEPEPVPAPVIIPEPEPEPEPMPVFIPVVESVDAETADELITDDVALAAVVVEYGAGEGFRDFINLGELNEKFEAGDVITLKILKERKLVSPKTKRLKILADGILTKAFTIKAESFSVQAIKMIELTGGNVVILKPAPADQKA